MLDSMHIYFSGIGGTGIGPLALVALQAGYHVSGSDKQSSTYTRYLISKGVDTIHIGQSYEAMQAVHEQHPIDWFVYTSALPIEQPDAPELLFCKEHAIQATKRDAFLNQLLTDKQQKMIAIAGTHGKTTTTAMMVWLCKQIGLPISYILPTKTSFADMGHYDPNSQYFVYEADEFDRNFLSFNPTISIITGIDWDHPDIYPTRDSYHEAFVQFIDQSHATILWQTDAERIGAIRNEALHILHENDPAIAHDIQLPGLVNRKNTWQVVNALQQITHVPQHKLITCANQFPGAARRFEAVAPGIYSDYAHTPPKVAGALQLGHEVAGDNLVVIYEGLHNTRQHFIEAELFDLFTGLKALYIVPSYLAREDPELVLWSPTDLASKLNPTVQSYTTPSDLNATLKHAIQHHAATGDTVLCLSAGGGGSLDEWIRQEFVVDTMNPTINT